MWEKSYRRCGIKQCELILHKGSGYILVVISFFFIVISQKIIFYFLTFLLISSEEILQGQLSPDYNVSKIIGLLKFDYSKWDNARKRATTCFSSEATS